MTFEKLLGLGPKEWQELSDEELHKILHPFFLVTRPDEGKRKTAQAGDKNSKSPTMVRRSSGSGMDSMQKDLFALATKAGIKLQ